MVKIRARKDCLNKGYDSGDVFDASSMGCFYVFLDSEGDLRTRLKEEFDIVDGQYLVRNVTRKEVVPGTYGIVQVSRDGKIKIQQGKYNSDRLREAAHILNQIAEALEDGTTF